MENSIKTVSKMSHGRKSSIAIHSCKIRKSNLLLLTQKSLNVFIEPVNERLADNTTTPKETINSRKNTERNNRHSANSKNATCNNSNRYRTRWRDHLNLWSAIVILLCCGGGSSLLGGVSCSDPTEGAKMTHLVPSLSSIPTPSPEESFTVQPSNASVVRGQMAVMKCKASVPVNHCRWYYVELDDDFYDEDTKPKLVKEFKPSNDIDCSIRFTKVRKVQEGQWLCQARRYMSTIFYNTRPAVMHVVTNSDEREYEDRNKTDESDESPAPPVGPTVTRPTPSGGPGTNTGILSDPRRPEQPRPDRDGGSNNRSPPTNNQNQPTPDRGTSIVSRPSPPLHPRDPEFGRPRDPEFGRPRDPMAPTAIPAIGPPPPRRAGERRPGNSRFPNTQFSQPDFGGQGGNNMPNNRPAPGFAYSADDHIQNTRTGGTALLPCQVNSPVTSCSWIMPNNALFVWNNAESGVGRSLSINTPITPLGESGLQEYEFVGNRASGNCSLRVHHVRHHDEGNWRCVVTIGRANPTHPALAPSASTGGVELQGPLLHLHLMDFHHSIPGSRETSMSTGANITLIILFLVGLVLFVAGTIVIYCCYKRVWSKPEQTGKITQDSHRSNNTEYSQQYFTGRNLKIVDPNFTDDFKLRSISGEYDNRKGGKLECLNLKNGQVQYSDISHYNEYMKMTQGSVRSSASSNTTMSTVAPDPLGRDRSISFGTTPSMSQMRSGSNIHHPMTARDGSSMISHSPPNPENVSFYEIHRQLQRPVSLYSTGHVYEEIAESKIPYNPMVYPQPHAVNSQGMLVTAQGVPVGTLAGTPIYTNVVEDHDGYLIPSKSAKIVNTPTGDDQYLTMTSPIGGNVLPGPHSNAMAYNAHMANMNNLSQQQVPITRTQIIMTDPRAVDHARRYSNDSNLSIEQNYMADKIQAMPGAAKAPSTPTKDQQPNVNINTTSPGKQGNQEKSSGTPNSKRQERQRMPLPSQPITLSDNNSSHQVGKLPLNKQVSNPQLMSQVHQRTASLPDTSDAATGAATKTVKHAKSPSLVPTPENYDVPRSLGNVPRTVNGSEVSLDDIDGTIV